MAPLAPALGLLELARDASTRSRPRQFLISIRPLGRADMGTSGTLLRVLGILRVLCLPLEDKMMRT